MIKQAVKTAFAMPWVWRAGAALRGAGVTVLMYHRITRQGDPFAGTDIHAFRAQMRWLRRHCRPIAADDFEAALAAPASGKPPVLVTFDDGYRDYHDHAYPVLQEFAVPALVFLATDFADRGGMIWTDALTWAVRRTDRTEVRAPWDAGRVHALSAPAERAVFAAASKHFLKSAADADRRAWLLALYAALGVDPEDGSAGRQMLAWDEVRATLGLTRYGGHTHTHPILARLAPEDQDREIRICRDRIADETGITPRWFAYPNGRPEDFDAHTRALLGVNGFDLGFSTVAGRHRPGMDLLAIRRQPTAAATLADFAWLVAGRGAS